MPEKKNIPRYIFLIVSLLMLGAAIAISIPRTKEFAIAVNAAEYPPTEAYSEDAAAPPASGFVDLDDFHFANTRYIKLLPGGTYKIELEKEPENANECLIWEIMDPETASVSSDGMIIALSPGETRVTARSFDGKLRRGALIEVSTLPDTLLDVPYISQIFQYPNGCESVSTVMALNYAGIDISVDDFIEKYLDMSPLPEIGEDGEFRGDSPWNSFIGDPRDYSGLCCYAPVITNALEKFVNKDRYNVLDLTGTPIETLCRDYVMQGTPVIIWGTMYMEQPYEPGWEWKVTGGEDGEVFRWVSPMHCLLLIGFDGENYYFNDPTAGAKVAYRKADVEIAYAGLFSQAVVVKSTNRPAG